MRPLPDIEVLHPREGVAVVECTGEHDLASNDEVEALLTDLVATNERVIVDVTNAEFVDSSFLKNLFQVDQLAKQDGKRLVLQFGTAPIVRSALQHSGILQVLDHASTRDEAFALGLDPPETGLKAMDEFLSILPADPTTLRPLRHSLGAWLDELGVTERSRDHVVLATHEAAANAMVHAKSTPVVVRARVTAGQVSVEISDRGRWQTRPETGRRGTGLALIEALVSEVEIEKGAQGTTVRLVQGQ